MLWEIPVQGVVVTLPFTFNYIENQASPYLLSQKLLWVAAKPFELILNSFVSEASKASEASHICHKDEYQRSFEIRNTYFEN